VFGNNPLYGAPNYDDLLQMVYEIAEYPCPKEGKPRSFLQHIGTDILRAYDGGIWTKWMDRKIKEEYRKFLWEHREIEPCCEHQCDNPVMDLDVVPPMYGVVISDCRFQNEAQLVAEHPNGVLLKFTADIEEADRRQFERDGYVMNGTQKSHQSEHQWDSIPEEWYNKIIDTTDMSVKEQTDYVRNLITKMTGVVNA